MCVCDDVPDLFSSRAVTVLSKKILKREIAPYNSPAHAVAPFPDKAVS